MTTLGKRPADRERAAAAGLRSPLGDTPVRPCAWPGCDCAGDYRAPLGRDRLREYQWLCLEHVRAFNREWNYFAGMSGPEIEAHQRADVTWHRPTWRIGTRAAPFYGFQDPFELFGDEPPFTPPKRSAPRTKADEMMDVLGLQPGFTLDELKRRYKALAKRHHPDLNGGDKAAEDRLKDINVAYTYLLEQVALG
ncbi:MAG: J domain-containing protein [Geminicoccaceae bacterium]